VKAARALHCDFPQNAVGKGRSGIGRGLIGFQRLGLMLLVWTPPVGQLLIGDALPTGKGTEVLAAFQPGADQSKHLFTVRRLFFLQN
jgi:hypothetical protein